MGKRWAVVAGLLTLSTVAIPAAAAGDPAVVRTDAGAVRGTVTEQVRTFEGVPSAAPPVGELRWRAPQPVQPWASVRDATAPGSVCPQEQNPEAPQGSTNEDCLYLNVTTPTGGAQRKPVVVWVPGGGFFMGAGSNYGPERLATRGDAVVVTINYRLGIFGFYGQHGLPGSGTFGLQDQQAALRWVQRNIGAFGGDPGNVTLAGESAGGMSTCAQLTSPRSAGLFHRAIMQSGSCDFDWPDAGQYPSQKAGSYWVPQDKIRRDGDAMAAELGCATVECLRAKPAAELMGQFTRFTSSATGTPVLPQDPGDALRAGRFHRVPVLSGNNHDEARSYMTAFNGGDIDAAMYQRLLVDMAGREQAARIAGEYPVSAYESPMHAWAAVTTDRIWSCTQHSAGRELARKVPVYSYDFADQHSPIAGDLGAAHAVELPYLFALTGIEFPFPPDQRRLSEQMLGYWTAFARTGDPNGPGRPEWTTDQALTLAPSGQGGIRPVEVAAEHHCAFWKA
ncbi:carboxylesterase/lipase family protein [Amycolatopsis magusensis]|uniref:Carboxylic ester hydrolase n=1 Tax=Amycolatopsis magusensis TaxID=882444 RepID=A0ABS4PL35_9PSEU|nr:carboxylesterase family protein [Amycolatopsis magusensis]MBP2180120.1 para-nitrobenzyl esterase [Amycolatopsis magusensis]